MREVPEVPTTGKADVRSKRPTAAAIVRAHHEKGHAGVTALCADLSDVALAALAAAFDGRASAPWTQTAPGARYARCGTCGEVHHYGNATSSHAARHARERAAKRLIASEVFRRQEAADAPKTP